MNVKDNKISNNDVVLLLSNARSIRNTWPVFKAAALIHNPGVLAITETWLSTDICDNYKYDNFQQFCASRDAKHPVGGVMLLFHPSYQVFKKKVRVSAPNTFDVVAVVSVADGHCWVLIYRPPDCTAEDTDQLCRYLDSLLCEHQYIAIMGYFNMSKINWLSTDEPQQVDVLQRKFLQFYVSWDLIK